MKIVSVLTPGYIRCRYLFPPGDPRSRIALGPAAQGDGRPRPYHKFAVLGTGDQVTGSPDARDEVTQLKKKSSDMVWHKPTLGWGTTLGGMRTLRKLDW